MSELPRQVFRAFKTRGYSLTSTASSTLCEVLKSSLEQDNQDPNESLETILNEIKDRIEKREIKTFIIDVDVIKNVIADLSSSDEDLEKEKFQLIDAFSGPKIEYDDILKSYKLNVCPTYQIHGDIYSRANMYRERYNFILQRLLRTKMFSLAGLTQSSSLNHRGSSNMVHEVYTVASLLGSQDERVLFGMIIQPEEGAWFLEDLTGAIKLDLSNCAMHSETYFYTEGSQVIVAGTMSNGVFRVSFIALPPTEFRQTSLEAYDIDDTFGNGTRPAQLMHLKELEVAAVDTMFVILSDVHLDKPYVIENLTKVFEGFESPTCQNLLFILIGNFSTKSFTTMEGRDHITNNFNVVLADLICSFPFLSTLAKFLLVPGPEDVGMCANILPRRAIPEYFTSDLRRKVKNITLASNPCRLRFYTQEIVIFRENLCKKFQRHSIFKVSHNFNVNSKSSSSYSSVPHETPKLSSGVDASALNINMGSLLNMTQSNSMAESIFVDKDKTERTHTTTAPAVYDISEMVVNTLLSNGHLCPLAATVKPIHWELDYALRLNPIPDMLILADHADQYCHTVDGCTAVNPGSFSSDASFIVYRPATKQVEYSSV